MRYLNLEHILDLIAGGGKNINTEHSPLKTLYTEVKFQGKIYCQLKSDDFVELKSCLDSRLLKICSEFLQQYPIKIYDRGRYIGHDLLIKGLTRIYVSKDNQKDKLICCTTSPNNQKRCTHRDFCFLFQDNCIKLYKMIYYF